MFRCCAILFPLVLASSFFWCGSGFTAPATVLVLAEGIIDDLATQHRMNIPRWKEDATGALRANHEDHTADPDTEIAQACQLIEEALMTDDIELARELTASASDMAGNSHEQSLIDAVSRWSDLVEEWAQQTHAAQAAALRVVQNPLDAESNLVLGRYLCFIKGDWRQGLPKLARGNDQKLRTLADLDINTPRADQASLEIADAWRTIADESSGLTRHRILLHAEQSYRRTYPALTGLARYALDEKMISHPLFVFGAANPPSENWVKERLLFRGTYGRAGSGRWANLEIKAGTATLVANRAGFIETLESFPPEGVEYYQIEAELSSDLLNGTAFEFGGQRMYFTGNNGAKGISLEGGWAPNVTYPIKRDQYYRFLIDVAPDGISFTVNDQYLGKRKTKKTAQGRIVIRGWEGHVRCRRLAVWAVPDPTLSAFVSQPKP